MRRAPRACAAIRGLSPACLPADYIAVQCTYFEKSATCNWLVPMHQDLSVPARVRPGESTWRGWSLKEGRWQVQPPAALLAQWVALRVHIDDRGLADGPLRLIPGTHRPGVVGAARSAELRRRHGEVTCAMPRGSVLALRPLLLHASSKSTASSRSRRRVLHFLFGPPALPEGLQWPPNVGDRCRA